MQVRVRVKVKVKAQVKKNLQVKKKEEKKGQDVGERDVERMGTFFVFHCVEPGER